MPLPLPNLDTRRWSDLVEEGRALIPQYAPSWTDHNVHDPGITLIELLAWLVEQEIYRSNRVPERHRRKFLALAGYPIDPPRPARVVLSFALAGSSPVNLPALLTFATTGAGGEGGTGELRRFRLTTPITVLPAAIQAIQSFDGERYVDRTRQWATAQPFPAWGDDPGMLEAGSGDDASPALYLGLDRTLPAGSECRLWLTFAGGRSGADERARIVAEESEQEALCRPPGPHNLPDCDGAAAEPASPAPAVPLRHHSSGTAWEYFDGTSWSGLTVVDETRAFTLDGAVVITGPANMQARNAGAITPALFYIRCRLISGRPDAAPLLADIAANAVVAEQATDARTTFETLPGVTPPAGQVPVRGLRQRLKLAFDATGSITSLAAVADLSWPEALVLDYHAATADAKGSLTCTLVHAGSATGLPGQALTLPDAPIAGGECRLWISDEEAADEWQSAPDIDASKPADARLALDPVSGVITFGDGEHGRLAARGAAVVAQYATTVAAAGNVASNARWRLRDADDAFNQALIMPQDLGALADSIGAITNRLPARGGAQEDLAHAAGRAAAVLWSHERLLELAPSGQATLDQVDHQSMLARLAPPRATTLLDYERLAFDVPGTAVGRARAWAALDPDYPCLRAPGTVTVTVVPTLPAGRPEPTPELLVMVRRYLLRRRTIGTRLLVVGPDYVEVRVKASVRTRPRADVRRTQADIAAALNAFLDPTRGGPSGRGWPFGRDVYRSEVLQVIDSVPGVDYVVSLELFADADEAPCGNVCIGATSLATPGQHEVEVA